MKFVSQLNYTDMPYITRTSMEGEAREKGLTTTVRRSGCGLCSAVMVAHCLIPDCEFEVEDALKIAYDSEANYRIGTSLKRLAPAFAECMGFDYEMTNDPERLRYCLRTGGAAILHIKGDREGHVGVFSHRGHYIMAFAEERDGRIAVMDPSMVEGKYEEDGRKGLVEVKNGVIALCDINVLVEDTLPATYSFYLFWRK